MKKIILIIIPLLLVSCNNQPSSSEPLTGDEFNTLLNADNIKEHLDTLSSGEYDGRASGSEGNLKACNYVATKFKEFGLSTVSDNENPYYLPYNQPYTRVFDKDHYFQVKVGEGDNQKSYRYDYQLTFVPRYSHSELTLSSSVVNYQSGVTDYSNQVVLADASQYRNIVTANTVFIYDSRNSFPMIEYGQGEYFTTRNTGINYLYISSEAKEQMQEQVSNGHNEIQIDYKVNTGEAIVNNVAGKLDNNKAKWIIISSHIDHVGRFDNESDGYFPGALDNASGTSSMLEIARILASKKTQLKYNYLFITFNGEEAGLYGSKAFVVTPIMPLNDIEAQYNIDMVGGGSYDYNLEIIGNYASYKTTIQAALEKYNITKYTMSGNIEDSDHYYFGVKKILAMTFCHNDDRFYHRPGDSNDKINYEILIAQLKAIGELFLNK